ncbi:hydantoinase B/oxoprolinase family protein [Phytohabitans suffuscus]
MVSDPVTLEVVRHALQGVAEEMGSIMKRAAFSPMIKEREDRSCALFSPDAELVAQAEHLPIHLALLAGVVPDALAWYGKENLGPGDILLHNDPYIGGSHLPDFTMITPIYRAGRHLGYAAVMAHMTDVGGGTPGGGGGVHAREIIEEGVRIPPVLIYRAGEVNKDVFALLTANVRIPEMIGGDLLAQAAAVRAGERAVGRIAERYGDDRLLELMRELIAYVERRTVDGIRDLPQGTARFVDHVDSDGNSPDPLTLACQVTVADGRIRFDFEGSVGQREGPVNASYAVVRSAAFYAVRCLLDGSIPTNAGCFRAVDVIAPPRTIVNPEPPAPVFGGSLITGQRTVDAIFGALCQLMPDRVTAAGMGSSNSISFGGYDHGRGRAWVLSESIGGGSGARLTKDGLSSSRVNLLNSPNTPVEIIEADYPLRVERYAIRDGSAGAGRRYGGFGTVKEYHLLDDAKVSILSDRGVVPPWGALGGEPGTPTRHLLISGDEERDLGTKATIVVRAGQRLVAMTAGGGGMGPPRERPDEAVEAHVRDGLVAREER